MADVWAPLQYGWGHVYWLTVEGIPVAWSQASTVTTAPTDYPTESPTLVVSGSARIGAVVDKNKGIAAGFPLTFKLLDSATLAAYMTAPSAFTVLTSDLTSSGGTVSVSSTSAFDASGAVYIGKERVTYSAKGASSFTVAARGLAGYAYPHESKSAGAVVSNTPRYWSGRFVTLYASPCDPTGYVTGTSLDDDAVAVWRGYLDGEPARAGDGDGFELSALPIDRMLARPLAGKLTGTVTDLEPRFKLLARDCIISVSAINSAGTSLFSYDIKFQVLPSASYGDLIGISQWNASAVAEFAAALTTYSAGSDIDGLDIVQATSTAYDGSAVAYNKGSWVPILRLAANSNIRAVTVSTVWAGTVAADANLIGSPVNAFPAGTSAGQGVYLNVAYSWSPYQQSGAKGLAPLKPHATVTFDGGDPGTLPSTGVIKIGDTSWTYAGATSTAAAGEVSFTSIAPVGDAATMTDLVGATVEVQYSTTGNPADTVRRVLHSSGESTLRSTTYDTLPGRIGLGLPEAFVDDDKIGDVLAEDWLSDIDLVVAPADESLADSVGSLLALSQRALVVTDDTTTGAALSAVYTSSAAGGYAYQLTDADLVAQPSTSVELARVPGPNVVSVELKIGDKVYGSVIETDASRVAFQGAVKFEATIPSSDRDELLPLAAGWGLARLAGDQQASIMVVDVAPWVPLRVGYPVDITLTHPSLWDWSSGSVGYVGRGRVLGREVQLSSATQRLHIVIDGQSVTTSLCPAAPVTAYAGTAGAPTTIDIPAGFYIEIQRALTAAAGNIRLLHYEPGEGSEGVSEGYTISAATVTAGVCRLTVATVIGGATLTASSYLTWPESANATAYQATFAHDADGSRWA